MKKFETISPENEEISNSEIAIEIPVENEENLGDVNIAIESLEDKEKEVEEKTNFERHKEITDRLKQLGTAESKGLGAKVSGEIESLKEELSQLESKMKEEGDNSLFIEEVENRLSIINKGESKGLGKKFEEEKERLEEELKGLKSGQIVYLNELKSQAEDILDQITKSDENSKESLREQYDVLRRKIEKLKGGLAEDVVEQTITEEFSKEGLDRIFSEATPDDVVLKNFLGEDVSKELKKYFGENILVNRSSEGFDIGLGKSGFLTSDSFDIHIGPDESGTMKISMKGPGGIRFLGIRGWDVAPKELNNKSLAEVVNMIMKFKE